MLESLFSKVVSLWASGLLNYGVFYNRCYPEDYPVDSEPPLHLSKENQLSESVTPINDLNFSGLNNN